jgi:hypothetical protein
VGQFKDFHALGLATSRQRVHVPNVTRSACLLGSLALLAVASPARADVPRRIANASLVVQRVAAELTRSDGDGSAQLTTGELMLQLPPTLSAETLIAAADATLALQPAQGDAKQKGSAPSKCDLGSSCSYRAILGYLVITRDLQIPGAPQMAVRLIPTSKALSGDTSPIVLRPRVDGAGSSWTGVDIAALF